MSTIALVCISILALVSAPAVTAAQPATPQVILDNRSVRVTVTTLSPGEGTGRHQWIEPEVGIVIDGQVMLESPLGRTVVRSGAAYWMPGLTPHDVRNDGNRPATMFEIFLKRCD